MTKAQATADELVAEMADSIFFSMNGKQPQESAEPTK